ncbi:TPA: hypothetical protein ACKQNM_005361 [Pseudomonas aeruginosa]
MNDTSNPYATPASALQPTQAVPPVIGDYDFRIGDVISEAWAKIKGVKGILIGAFILTLLFGGIGLMSEADPIAFAVGQMIASLVATAVGYPFFTGLTMIGIRRAADQPATFNEMFNYFGMLVPLLLTGLLMMLMVYVGFFLLIIPGLYLSVAYMLALPLVAERGLTPWQALETSRKAISRHWFKVFGLLLVLSLLMLVSMIPLFIGLIWTGPLFVVSMGILYRTIFGVRPLGN